MRQWVVALLVSGCGRVAFEPRANDAPAPPFVECTAALAPAMATIPTVSQSEPTVYIDGLRLLVTESEMLRESTRPTANDLFGPVGPRTVFLPLLGDPSFFDRGGTTVAIAADGGPSMRRLRFCPSPATSANASLITVSEEPAGTVILDDHDGPGIAMLDGELLMVFNRTRRLYQARPTTSDLLAWNATEIALPFMVDDPAITSDGQILLVQRVDDGLPGLYALRWNGTTFVDPILIVERLTGSPSIGVQDATSFELIATADTRGTVETHHSTCVRR